MYPVLENNKTFENDFTPNLPEHYSSDVIANIWVSKLGRYVYLSGTILWTSENDGKVAHIYIAPLNKVFAVRWNNIVTSDAMVEINYRGERIAVIIEQIDGIKMEVSDEWGNRAWINVTSIIQKIMHQSLAEQWILNQVQMAAA